MDILAVVKTGAFFRYLIKSTPHESIMKQQQATDILEDLRTESIASVNGALSRTDLHTVEERSKIYFAAKKQNMETFKAKWVELYQQQLPDIAGQARSIAILLSTAFLDKFNCSIKHHGAPSFPELVKQILNEQDQDPDYPTDPVRKEALYYVFGWRLGAAEKEALRHHKSSPM